MRREPMERRKQLPLLGALVVSLLAGALTYALVSDGDPEPGTGRTGETSDGLEEPAIPQAEWKFETFAAGTAGAPTKVDRRAVANERDSLVAAITRVADALVLDPGSLSELTGKHVAPAAAKALRNSGLVVPGGLTDIRTTVRKASIGLDSNGGARAAARLKIVAQASNEGRTVKLIQEANLFLKKSSGSWQVVAFDGSLRPGRIKGSKA